MKKLKAVILILLTLSCLVIFAIGSWLFQLNDQITKGLANKKFLPPTQYFSSPQSFSNGTKSFFLQNLNLRQYRSRGWDQKIFPGDYATTDLENCRTSVPITLPDEAISCLWFIAHDVGDPATEMNSLQLIVWDSQDRAIGFYQGNPLQPTSSVQLEAQLFAQFLDSQPITQSYKALGEIPPYCLNAVLAIEDSQFLEHSGFSLTGMTRAFLTNTFGGSVKQGGSTITQQMVKNYFLTAEKTLKRKVTELAMSVLLEAHSSKDQILETYLNIIYLGQNGPFQIRGFGAAADYYFQKPLEQLELADCALLAAVLNSPGLYDPFRKPENAFRRRDLVLQRMQSLDLISADEAISAKNETLPKVPSRPQFNETAPYFIDAALKEIKKLGFSAVGLKVFTGLVVQDQVEAQKAIQQHLAKLENQNKKIKSMKEQKIELESVLISIDNSTGLISSLVGGRNFRQTQFNRALEAHRQVGSIIKPFVFLTALLQDSNWTPLSTLEDTKFNFRYEGQSWSPDNYGKKYYGPVPMYFALKNSLNASTASLGLKVGLGNIISTAKTAGISSSMSEVPSLTLGAFEAYPIEIAQSYVTLARMGSFIPIATIRALKSESGELLYQRSVKAEEVFDPAAVAVLISMMKQTVTSGTAQLISAANFPAPSAGKTGTTSDNKDAWFAGMTSKKTSIVWVGNDQPTSNGLTGSSGAVPIWLSFMKNTLDPESITDFPWPETVEAKKVTLFVSEDEAKNETDNLNSEIELLFKK